MDRVNFTRLNDGWNAEPNDPAEQVEISGDTVELSFALNPWAYDADEGAQGRLLFPNCAKWRLGPTNDEGWYRGRCRYGKAAPVWGEFYEITGPEPLSDQPTDWHAVAEAGGGNRHFLFYLKDNTFECWADDWQLSN